MGGGGGDTPPPGPAVDLGGSGNRAVARPFSCFPRGWFAPFTPISRYLSEFGENGPYLARAVEVSGPPPGPVADRVGSSGNPEIPR